MTKVNYSMSPCVKWWLRKLIYFFVDKMVNKMIIISPAQNYDTVNFSLSMVNMILTAQSNGPKYPQKTYYNSAIAALFEISYLNSLRPSDAIWRHRSGSTLAQVMGCCLTTPSHHLNQCWLISKAQWHSADGNFTRDTSAISHWN